MTFWPLANSDVPTNQTFHQFHDLYTELDLHRIMSGLFPWIICNGCGMPAGNAYPFGHLVPSPISGLACAPIVETRFLGRAMSLLDFSPRIPLGTLSILLLDRIYDSSNKVLYIYSRSIALRKTVWSLIDECVTELVNPVCVSVIKEDLGV